MKEHNSKYRNNISKYYFREKVLVGLGIITGRNRYRLFKMIKNHELLSEEQIRQEQEKEIIKLLRIAKDEVPFYREILREIKIENSNNAKQLLNELPIIKKSDIQKNYQNMVSENSAKKRTYKINTGGSTGSPLTIIYDKEAMEKKDAAFMRSLTWGGWKLGDPIAVFWGGPQEINKAKSFLGNIKKRITGQYFIGSYTYDNSLIHKWIDFIKNEEIKFLYGYASVMYNIALYLLHKEKNIPKINAIFSTAEMLYPEHRMIIEEAFQCKVYNQYGSREVVNISAECEKGNMHILSDMVYVEFLKSKDIQKYEKIVLTSFTNTTMPIIRYEIEDYGNKKEGICECGRPFPIMDLSIGRNRDHIRKSDGTMIHPSFFTKLLYGIEEIGSYQFRQKDYESIQLSIVKNREFSKKARQTIENLEKIVQNELKWKVKIEIKEVEGIKVLPSGKHQYVISEMK